MIAGSSLGTSVFSTDGFGGWQAVNRITARMSNGRILSGAAFMYSLSLLFSVD
ncbi:hypothetical protein NCCP2716_27070 [Sporosarcina sp. NCCP-2716]|nr:hypothetical protein NCCP2716_27070 [Sporosarcina sp. NCCP-2716]